MIQYGLEEDEIAAIKNILAQHEEVDQVILYGSRAKGNFKPASDIDLVLKGEKLNIAIQNKIANELDDLLLPYIFDLSIFHQISNADLLEHIDRVGVLLYEFKLDDQIWNEWVFSDFVDINPLIRLKSSEEYSFIEMKDLTDGQKTVYPSVKRKLSGGSRFQEEDTLFARITPCLENGKICQVKGLDNGIGFGSTEFLVFRGREKVSDNDFVFYLSRSFEVRKFAEQHLIGTSGRQRVNKEAFTNLRLRLPAIYTQQQIVHILSSLDDKFELNRQANETLEEIAKTLFQEMCVPKGDELPEGWRAGRLADFVYVNPKLSIRKDSQAKYVEMKDLSEILSSIKSYVPREFSSGSKFQNGDVLMARITPCLENGKTGIVSFLTDDEVAWGSTEFLVLRGKGAIDTSFVYCLARSNSFREFAIKSMVGSSGRQRVAEPTLLQYPLAVPPDDILESFSLITQGLLRQVYCNHNQNLSLVALRDSLLPKLMNGDIRLA